MPIFYMKIFILNAEHGYPDSSGNNIVPVVIRFDIMPSPKCLVGLSIVDHQYQSPLLRRRVLDLSIDS